MSNSESSEGFRNQLVKSLWLYFYNINNLLMIIIIIIMRFIETDTTFFEKSK